MEKIGHFLEEEVSELYLKAKAKGLNKKDASPFIEEKIDLQSVLQKSSKNWDGGYAMAGLLGHGDAFVLRDPSGIRPTFYYQDDEVVVVASERPVIQTVFNVDIDTIQELDRGHALIIKKDGSTSVQPILEQKPKKSCSFERIYFSRGSDASIYKERKNLGKLVFPQILKSIDNDISNSVFSFIPNTAETSFYGMMEAAEDVLNQQKTAKILAGGGKLSAERVTEILSERPRFEKIAIKDAKLRTFIADDNSRDDLVAHVYDVTYGVVKPTDNLVIIDDSIVRGTTLKKSIIKILDRLNPKKIVVVSSAPQIRYPDCYGIDMAKIGDFIAFRAALELLKETNQYHIMDTVYEKSVAQRGKPDCEIVNFVKEVYLPFTDEEISAKTAQMLKTSDIKASIEVIYQSVDNLHIACPEHLGDWYFTGDYPTDGGNRVVNEAFINFYEGSDKRAY
jgi:amidophosphoribosyltransferase